MLQETIQTATSTPSDKKTNPFFYQEDISCHNNS